MLGSGRNLEDAAAPRWDLHRDLGNQHPKRPEIVAILLVHLGGEYSKAYS